MRRILPQLQIFYKFHLYLLHVMRDAPGFVPERAMWKYYALLSAFFASLTAIFAKVGVKDINSDLATAIRTTVILLLKEPVSPRVIIGALLITCGSMLLLIK